MWASRGARSLHKNCQFLSLDGVDYTQFKEEKEVGFLKQKCQIVIVK